MTAFSTGWETEGSDPFQVEAVITDQVAGDEQGLHQHGRRGFCQDVVDQPEAGAYEEDLPQSLVVPAEGPGRTEQRAQTAEDAEDAAEGKEGYGDSDGHEQCHDFFRGGDQAGEKTEGRKQAQAGGRPVPEEREMAGNKDAGNDQTGDYFRPFLELEGEEVKADRDGDEDLGEDKVSQNG